MKIHGKRIVNLLDLQRSFDPLALEKQLEVYAKFVNCHSKHLALMIGEKRAELLSKNLFSRILELACEDAQWPEKKTAKEGLDALLRQAYEKLEDGKNDLKIWEAEIAAHRCYEKLSHIEAQIEGETGEYTARRTLILLAICEMAEMDAMTCRFRQADSQDGRTGVHKSDRNFVAKDTLQLQVGDTPYAFWYHDENELAQDERIRTVEVTASGSLNAERRAKKAIVELYSSRDGSLVCRTEMAYGEKRWLTAAGNRVIGFLPDESEAGGLKIRWENHERRNLMIESAHAQTWMLDARRVSCFAAGGEKEGFLLVYRGRVVWQYDHQFNDEMNHIRMEMVERAVEVSLSEQGYRILSDCGSIVSNYAQPQAARVVTLLRRQ